MRFQSLRPKNIEIEYELAGIGSRFLANLYRPIVAINYCVRSGFPSFSDPGFGSGLLFPAWLILALNGAWPSSTFMGDIPRICSVTIAIFLLHLRIPDFRRDTLERTIAGQIELSDCVSFRDGGYPITPFSAFSRNLLRARLTACLSSTLPGALIAGLYPGLEALWCSCRCSDSPDGRFFALSSRSQRRLGAFYRRHHGRQAASLPEYPPLKPSLRLQEYFRKDWPPGLWPTLAATSMI